jgi:hypothetical protein
MSGRLVGSAIQAPGFQGLNSQDSEVTLESGYATSATNCIIDRFGRLGSRRGWAYLTTNNGTLADNEPIEFIYEFKNTDGNYTILSAGGGKLFTGDTTLTEKQVRNTANNANIPLSVSTGNWQGATLQDTDGVGALGEVYLAQQGNPLLVYREVSGTYIYNRACDHGSVPTNLTITSFDPNCVLSAYGRIWVASLSNNKITVFYSRQFDGHHFTGAGSGFLDVSSIVGGNDEIVALASHNNFLVIFMKNNIVVYSGADTPTTSAFQLSDVIRGVGCIARDSVQNTGTDLIFLSKSGVRSLARTIQEKSMPMRELSINVRDILVRDIQNEILSNIKSAYFERDAFYILNLPSTNQIYCFDMRVALPNGASRVTTWNISYSAFCSTEARELYLGVKGGIAKYNGYLDNTSSYRMAYFTANTDIGQPSQIKFLKKGGILLIGNSTQDVVVKFGFDYNTLFENRVFFGNTGNLASEYNIAEYNIGEYSGGLSILEARVNLGGSGRVVKLGIETVVEGSPISIQKVELFFKSGKVY